MRLLGYLSIVSIGLLVSLAILACGEATAPAPVVFSYTCDPSAGPDLSETQQALLDSLPSSGRRNIDETRNRLVYGVLAEQGHIVEDFFSSLHLPCDLLLLEVGTIVVGAQEAGFGEP